MTNFNGDPDRITLYGTGSGAVLASLVVMLETVNGLCSRKFRSKNCCSYLGGTGKIKGRKPLVHRLILNDQTFLSPQMTSIINEFSSYQEEILAQLSCSTLHCLRNHSRIKTEDFLELNTYAKDSTGRNYLTPLENPFPFFHSHSENEKNPLRAKFYQQTHTLLPENLQILLTISSSINHSLVHSTDFNTNLINYAYTKWNIKTNEFYFDQSTLNYHQQILAPLIKYAQHVSNHRKIFLLEKYTNRYQSELPLTFGYVLAPSMSVFNETYLNATESEKKESLKMMNLFGNLIHNG